MWIFDRLKSLIKRKESKKSDEQSIEKETINKNIAENTETRKDEMIESLEKNVIDEGSIRIDKEIQSNKEEEVLEIDNNRLKSVLIDKKERETPVVLSIGYMASATRNIENTLYRIESSIPTKDWLKNELNENYKNMIEAIKSVLKAIESHELESEKRFEVIESALNRLEELSKEIKGSIGEQISQEITRIKKSLPLTSRMKDILNIVKERGEISYEELASKLNITVSALRGLLSEMSKRCDEIERFEKDNKGWIRYKQSLQA